MMKRIFDFVAAAGGLTLLSPLLIWSGWSIKREDGGPVFFLLCERGFRPRSGLPETGEVEKIKDEKMGGLVFC
jgi:hypothetical protein